MGRTKVLTSQESHRKQPPAMTPEARENQLISLAVDLVEKRLIEGTASSQETVHFLKQGSMKSRMEMEKLEEENKLLRARTESLQSACRMDELYAEAIRAMKTYNGSGDRDDY